ncbi:hypothetical protein EXIGLDRAFT_750920 [Exidia glandulosa HHB12029]|uniref:Uncharacterized protein n=1 Tax=Exidia glandulosa HHB12029 TaxID=1314781 RepID=A0A165G1Y7_EXIGL|nr:hypothetical protein EXIGLDRAFT_750920 [Exidia glandulosa HHB12029]
MSGVKSITSPAFPTDPSRWSSIIAEWVKSVKEHGGAVIGPVKIPSAPSGPGGSPGGSTPGGGSPSGGDTGGGGDEGGGDDGGGEDGGSDNDGGGSSGSPSPTSVPSSGSGGSPSGGDDGDSGSSTSPPSGGGGGGSGGGNVTSRPGETATSQPSPLTGSSPTSSPGQTSGSNLSTTPFTQSTSTSPTSTPTVSHARARNVNVIAIVLPIVIVLLLLTALLAFFLFRRRQLRRQRNGIRFDEDDEPAPRPRGGAATPSPADFPTVNASGESSFILRHPFAATYHASTSSATLDHQFTSGSGSVIGSGNFSFASAHQGHGSTPGVHVADINDPFADPYNVLRERHRALLANAAMWTPASGISGTSYFGESSTGAVEDASRQDLGPGRSDTHLAPPPPPSSESRSHSPHT